MGRGRKTGETRALGRSAEADACMWPFPPIRGLTL